MIPLRDNIRNRSWPIMNVLFILMNIAVFILELRVPPPSMEGFILQWALIPRELLSNPWTEWRTLFTAMFLHGGWSHIIGNIMYLWIFGDNVEDKMGHLRYAVFYLVSGLGAAAAQILLDPASEIPMIGASGAIAGVLGAYFILFPRARVQTLIPLGFFSRIVEVPAFFFLGFWFLVQALQSYGSLLARSMHGNSGGVAWWAHAGGFVSGLILVWVFRKK